MSILKNKIENIFINAINECNFEIPAGIEIIRNSDRPDLSDFQSNIAMSLAKIAKSNPRQIATDIASKITDENLNITIDGPGFINIKLSYDFISEILSSETFDVKDENPKKIIIDYGGPNVAKSLHVGHLRSSIIGEALKNLSRFKGHNVISDIHLGDWGLPMGLIITVIKEQGLELPLTVDKLNAIYPEASKRSKEDENFMKQAQIETKKLQNGDEENLKIWKSFWTTSTDDMKKLLSKLNVEFDLFYGESHANDDVNLLVKEYQEKGYTIISEGAEVIDLSNYPFNGADVPPFIVLKSNGAVMYGMTDMATMYDRIKRQNADIIFYVVDSRQALHFHQVFSVANITTLSQNTKLEHLGFGSVMGSDGKPLKTRNGDNMPLEVLIEDTITAARKKIDENEKTSTFSDDEKNSIATDVAVAAMKFADLINPRTTDYIFNIEKFVSFEGKTGPYILYTAVRIKSLLKTAAIDLKDAKIKIVNDNDKALALKISEFTDIINRSFDARAIHILTQYIYDLAVSFNNFYHSCKIMTQEDSDVKLSWLKLSEITLEIFNKFAKIIKINIPERM